MLVCNFFLFFINKCHASEGAVRLRACNLFLREFIIFIKRVNNKKAKSSLCLHKRILTFLLFSATRAKEPTGYELMATYS